MVWRNLFITVNMHPGRHISFSKWIKKISTYLVMGEESYSHTNLSLHGAIPEFWKHMKAEDYKSVIKKLKNLN